MSNLYYSFSNADLDVQQKVEHLRKRSDALKAAHTASPDDYIKQTAAIYASFAGCMELLAKQLPYKAGDRVRLTKAPKCEGGWAESKHFLVEGAVGTIKAVGIDYLMRNWSVYVEFDDESWIPSTDYADHKKGVPVPVDPDHRHVYGFAPHYIAAVEQGGEL